MGPVGSPEPPSSALLGEGFLVVGPLVEDSISGDIPPPLFATCVARRWPSVPLQQWGNEKSLQAVPVDLQGHTKYDPELMVRQP